LQKEKKRWKEGRKKGVGQGGRLELKLKGKSNIWSLRQIGGKEKKLSTTKGKRRFLDLKSQEEFLERSEVSVGKIQNRQGTTLLLTLSKKEKSLDKPCSKAGKMGITTLRKGCHHLRL